MSSTASLICYLSPRAQEAYEFLKSCGMDADLALTFVEINLPESELWELPEVSSGTAIIREDINPT